MAQLGLEDLILEGSNPPRLDYIPVDWIHVGEGIPPSPQLLESVRVHRTVMMPILVNQRQDGRYECVAGRRRVLAAREAGLATVPAAIMNLPEFAPVLLTSPIIENKIRSDNAAMASEHVDALFDRGAEEDTISGALGISKAKVKNVRRPWTALIPGLRDLWRTGAIKANVAIAASKLGKTQQDNLLALYGREGALTVRDVAREAAGGFDSTELPLNDAQLTGWKAKARGYAESLEMTIRAEANRDPEAADLLTKLIPVLDAFQLRSVTFAGDAPGEHDSVAPDAEWSQDDHDDADSCDVLASGTGAADGPCAGCGGEWIQGVHFSPNEIAMGVSGDPDGYVAEPEQENVTPIRRGRGRPRKDGTTSSHG